MVGPGPQDNHNSPECQAETTTRQTVCAEDLINMTAISTDSQ